MLIEDFRDLQTKRYPYKNESRVDFASIGFFIVFISYKSK